jgi:ABC-type iron transport system FetAB ATPase subunit
MTLLRIDNLQYLDFPPLNLTLDYGESISITGQSGVGKSLLLRAIADLDPHSGTMCLEGRECLSFTPNEWRHNVCLLPTESQWWEDMVIDHFPAISFEDKYITAWLDMLSLDKDFFLRPVSRLSSGERQRLALIRVLINTPKVLLLDEPTASLDTTNARHVEKIISTYVSSKKAAAIWISHNPEQAKRIATRHFYFEGKTLVEIQPASIDK